MIEVPYKLSLIKAAVFRRAGKISASRMQLGSKQLAAEIFESRNPEPISETGAANSIGLRSSGITTKGTPTENAARSSGLPQRRGRKRCVAAS